MKKKGLKKTDLQCAIISLITISTCTQNNNIRSLRVQSSDNQRLCYALTIRIMK